jgi:hypothetical protein
MRNLENLMSVDRWMMRLCFFAICLVTAIFVMLLGRVVQMRHNGKGNHIPNRLLAFLILAGVGAALSALADYWSVFSPRHHSALGFVVQSGALCAFGAGLGRTQAEFIAANGGTPGAALASLLRHPGQSMLRLQRMRLNRGQSVQPPLA